MDDFLMKAKAVMIGHAVGDALGVPVEFRSREYLDEHPVTGMTGYGTYPVPAGAWSDDTSMSLCALKSLARDKNVIYFKDIMRNFRKWYDNGEFTPTGETFDCGNTCSEAIMLGHGLDGEYFNGNGSLMRIHPFTLFLINSKVNKMSLTHLQTIGTASALTHAHTRSTAACFIYSVILWELLEKQNKECIADALSGVRKFIAGFRECGELKRFNRLFDGIEKLDRSEIMSGGYVVHTLEAAVWCLLTTDSYRECVLKAVNLGDDTDTTAAVAGALAGALYGYGAIPEEWRNTLLKREYIEDLCEKAFN